MNLCKFLFLKINYYIAFFKKFFFKKNKTSEPIYLMYHSIDDKSIGDTRGIFSRSKKDFENDCKLISLFSKIFKQKVVITFDDGYASSLNAAIYAFKKYRIESIIFLITDCINKTGFISTDMIRNISYKEGIKFGFHGCTHTPLTKLNNLQIQSEIKNGRLLLEDLCEKKIENFSYPHGLRSRETDILLAKNGFYLLFTSEYGCSSQETIINEKKDVKYKLVSRNCILNFHSQIDLYFLLIFPSFNIMFLKQKIKSFVLRLKIALDS